LTLREPGRYVGSEGLRPPPNSPAQPPAVTGPDGNGTVTVTIDTTGMAVGTYTVTITGRLLTQTISFQVKKPDFG
jgi:hypothetical protein